MLSIPLSILVCASASLFCAFVVSVQALTLGYAFKYGAKMTRGMALCYFQKGRFQAVGINMSVVINHHIVIYPNIAYDRL